MKRHREQKGYLFKRSGVWYVRHHDNRIEGDQLVRKQVSTRIGLIRDFPSKAEAREEARRVLAPINEGSQKPAVVQPLVQFAEQQFFPFVRGQVTFSTGRFFQLSTVASSVTRRKRITRGRTTSTGAAIPCPLGMASTASVEG